MKKTFPLHVAGQDDARVLDAVKNDLRKYLKRERKKTFPEGFDTWNFDCKIGLDRETAAAAPVDELISDLDRLAGENAGSVYVEILAVPGLRPARPVPATTPPSV